MEEWEPRWNALNPDDPASPVIVPQDDFKRLRAERVSGVPGHGHGNDPVEVVRDVLAKSWHDGGLRPLSVRVRLPSDSRVAADVVAALRSAGLLAGGPQPGGRE